jgi:hypothetical protein
MSPTSNNHARFFVPVSHDPNPPFGGRISRLVEELESSGMFEDPQHGDVFLCLAYDFLSITGSPLILGAKFKNRLRSLGVLTRTYHQYSE